MRLDIQGMWLAKTSHVTTESQTSRPLEQCDWGGTSKARLQHLWILHSVNVIQLQIPTSGNKRKNPMPSSSAFRELTLASQNTVLDCLSLDFRGSLWTIFWSIAHSVAALEPVWLNNCIFLLLFIIPHTFPGLKVPGKAAEGAERFCFFKMLGHPMWLNYLSENKHSCSCSHSFPGTVGPVRALKHIVDSTIYTSSSMVARPNRNCFSWHSNLTPQSNIYLQFFLHGLLNPPNSNIMQHRPYSHFPGPQVFQLVSWSKSQRRQRRLATVPRRSAKRLPRLRTSKTRAPSSLTAWRAKRQESNCGKMLQTLPARKLWFQRTKASSHFDVHNVHII